MTIDTNDILNSILESLSRIDYIHPEDIPNIDLYMDQVTTFMDTQLSSTKRYADDKILTKTMINNYAKNNLLPPPVKKKYSKEQILDQLGKLAGKKPTSEEAQAVQTLQNLANTPGEIIKLETINSSERNQALKAVDYI